ncbi:MAG: hypothetical protein HFH82_01060 [Lachnospiraceae bacterium]|nr:hypothetical protein [Lachnospiraceae bacterium]
MNSIIINTDNGTVESFTIILSSRSQKHLGEIINLSGIKYYNYLNQPQKISFNVNKNSDEFQERLWTEINDLKLIYVKEVDTYFEIHVTVSNNDCNIKSITGISLCESELSQKIISNLEVNTEADISRDDYVITQFYNPDKPNASLLHRVLSEVPAYKIKYVAPSLMTLQRSFSVNDISIYDFLTGDCATEFDCIFLFDSTDRSISVYDLCTICNDCGYRNDYTDTCPHCGSNNLKYFGEDTTIFVSSENLTDEVQLETDIDNIKNCFILEAGDDIMTTAVMSYIPSGGNRIFYIPPPQLKDMPIELVEKIQSYNTLYDSSINDYHKITEQIYECIERITYYTSNQMPDITIPDTTASTEAAKLTISNLNPLSLSSLTTYTSLATINSALINYAKVFVRSGFVKVDVDTGSFKYNGVSNGISSGVWTGRFKITNYSNKEDIAYSSTLIITVNDDYQSFMNEKILKNIASNNTDDNSVYNVLGIKELSTFQNTLKLYCLNRLISFRDAINGVLSILMESNAGNVDSELYTPFYSKYYDKLQACNNEITIRKSEIESWEKKKKKYESQKLEIQQTLDFKKYLGENLYGIFTTYIRESKYTNSNYISDGLSDEKIFERALEFIEIARKELIKSSYYQHSIRTNLYNLLLMEEFSPIVNKFQLGNFIRVRVDEEIYRLRLVSYEIDFDNLGTLNTEFSDMTKTAHGSNDIHDILKQASSIASTYSYVSKQASNGNSAQNTLTDLKTNGLNSALMNIKNNSNEEIIIDNNGLTAKSYDDITDSYSPEQLVITHNILAYSDDDFRTVKCALGKHAYYKFVDDVLVQDNAYGLTADFVTAGNINGSQIIAGQIYSVNYSSVHHKGTHLNLDDGTLTFADGKIVYDGKVLKLKGIDIDWSTTNEPSDMWTSINANTEGIKLEAKRAFDAEEELSGRINVNSDAITLEVKRASDAENSLSTKVTQTAKEIRTEMKDTKEGLESSIATTAESLNVSLKNAKTALETSISTVAGNITSEITRATNAEEILSTKLTQTENKIVLKADANGKIVQVALNADPTTGTEFKVNANNINLSADDILNLIAGGTINLTSGNINITSDNWGVDSQGNMWCNKINAFQITGDAINQFNNAVLNSDTIQKINRLIDVLDQRLLDIKYSQPLTVSGTYRQSPDFINGFYDGKYDMTNLIGITITFEYYYSDNSGSNDGDNEDKYYYNTYEAGVGVSNNKSTFNVIKTLSYGQYSYDNTHKGTYSVNIDVSDLTGEYYIGACIRGYDGYTHDGVLQFTGEKLHPGNITYYVKIVNVQTF